MSVKFRKSDIKDLGINDDETENLHKKYINNTGFCFSFSFRFIAEDSHYHNSKYETHINVLQICISMNVQITYFVVMIYLLLG